MAEIDNLVEEYIRAHRKSHKLHERARKIFAADGATHIARVLDPFRPYITHAKGSRKWDVDGNEYVDYIMGHGALILGHSHSVIVEAVKQQMCKGVHYGERHDAYGRKCGVLLLWAGSQHDGDQVKSGLYWQEEGSQV